MMREIKDNTNRYQYYATKSNLQIQSNPYQIVIVIQSLKSCVRLFATLWIVAHQAPLSMGFPRQECWSELPFSLVLITLSLNEIRFSFTLFIYKHYHFPFFKWKNRFKGLKTQVFISLILQPLLVTCIFCLSKTPQIIGSKDNDIN